MNSCHFRYALLAGSVLLAACNATPSEYQDIRPVRTTVLHNAQAASLQVYAGEIRARYEIPLSFRVAGKISARLVEVGQQVQAGQDIARLEPSDYGLEASAKRAQLAGAESDLRQQELDLNRYRELLQQQFISQAEFDRRQNGVNVAREKVKQAQADLGVSSNRTQYTRLSADQAGIISEVYAEAGQVVQAGQAVARLAIPSEKEVKISIPESRLAHFKQATAFQVRLWSRDKVYQGKLRELAPQADPQARTYSARIQILNPDQEIALGMSASVAHVSSSTEKTAFAIPLTALLAEKQQQSVWVLDGKNLTVKKRAVQVQRLEQQQVWISQGLQAGEEIVTAGVHLLREGQKVARVDANPAPGKPALLAPQPVTEKAAS